MPLTDLILILLWAVALIALFPLFRRIWQGGVALDRLEHRWRRIWPYGERLLRGWIRAQVSIYICGYFILFALAGVGIAHTEWPLKLLFAATALAGFIGVLLMLVSTVLIILFNAPKFLVIPRLRSEEGLLTRRARSSGGRSSK